MHENEKAQRERVQGEVAGGHKKMVGVVVSAGKMDRTVKVRIPGQRWEGRIGKVRQDMHTNICYHHRSLAANPYCSQYFADHTNHLVHDPNNSLLAGDVVELHRLRVSTVVHHVVADIVTPFGKPIRERPPVPTADERLAAYKKKRFAKLTRRFLRLEAAKGNAEAIGELKSMGLDPGHNAEAGKGQKAGLQPHVGKTRDSGKGAILGAKGQKLPKGVLPGGKHEVGRIDERARHNKGRATKLDRKAQENLLEAEEKGRGLEQQGVGADPLSSATIPRGRVD